MALTEVQQFSMVITILARGKFTKMSRQIQIMANDNSRSAWPSIVTCVGIKEQIRVSGITE
jgi:hypothetical protein